MVMEKQRITISNDSYPSVFIATADEHTKSWAIKKIMELRKTGASCETDLLGRSLKSQMREADRQHADFVVIVGEQELRQQQIVLKNMNDGEQMSLPAENIVAELQKLIKTGEKGKAR